MTGNLGRSTDVVFVAIIERGSQSRSFSSRMSPGGSAAEAERDVIVSRAKDHRNVRIDMANAPESRGMCLLLAWRVGARAGAGDREIDQFLAAEKPFPVVVPLSF